MTIGGLLPLLSETSLQAEFFKPMALIIIFGLLATTMLVLIVVPALVAIQNDLRWRSEPKPPLKHAAWKVPNSRACPRLATGDRAAAIYLRDGEKRWRSTGRP
jgi:hypothetical protein